MTDAHHATFKEFIDNTPWEKYGRGRDPRCEDSAVLGGNKKLGDVWKVLPWTLSGKMGGLIGEPSERELQAKANGQGNGNAHSGSQGNGYGSRKRVLPVAPSNQPQDEVFR